MAGVLQMDPGPFTFRALLRMFMARQRAAWDHTAMLLSVQVTNKRPDELNPYRRSQREYGAKAIEAEYHKLERRRRMREKSQ